MAGGRSRRTRPPGPVAEPVEGRAAPGRNRPTLDATGAPLGRNRMQKDGAPGDEGDPKDAAMDQLKWEVAGELSLDDDLQDPDELTVREAGKVGGNMVKRLVKKGKGELEKER